MALLSDLEAILQADCRHVQLISLLIGVWVDVLDFSLEKFGDKV